MMMSMNIKEYSVTAHVTPIQISSPSKAPFHKWLHLQNILPRHDRNHNAGSWGRISIFASLRKMMMTMIMMMMMMMTVMMMMMMMMMLLLLLLLLLLLMMMMLMIMLRNRRTQVKLVTNATNSQTAHLVSLISNSGLCKVENSCHVLWPVEHLQISALSWLYKLSPLASSSLYKLLSLS